MILAPFEPECYIFKHIKNLHPQLFIHFFNQQFNTTVPIKKRGFDVKYTPEANKQTNKQIIAHRMK